MTWKNVLTAPMTAVSMFSLLLGFTGCEETIDPTLESEDVPVTARGIGGKADSSVEAVFIDIEFTGSFTSDWCFGAQQQLDSQLLYTIGQLNGQNSVGRLDQVETLSLDTTDEESGCKVDYTVRMPVAWGDPDNIPETLEIVLPADISSSGISAFVDTYSHDCVPWNAHDVDAGSFWYYFRPAQCQLSAESVIRPEAAVSMSPISTTGKYPEYHRVWEDGVFNVVAIFGKFEDGATNNWDAGISSYNRFLGEMGERVSAHDGTTTPSDLQHNPGVSAPVVSFDAQIDSEHALHLDALLVDNVRVGSEEFDELYASLTGRADLIIYNGHAGLGANIRALARKGSWLPGQYVIVFMNGCDTYTYIDSALFDAHSAINPGDLEGTRHVDLIGNAMPAGASLTPEATLSLVDGLLAYDAPRTYEQLLDGIDDSQVAIVTGEQDNEYFPGWPGDEPPVNGWSGLDESGTVAAQEETHFETPALTEGRYTVSLTGTGDADLYVRVGEQPSIDLYDCGPYLVGSTETCVAQVSESAKLFVMVRGWAPTSDFRLQIQGE